MGSFSLNRSSVYISKATVNQAGEFNESSIPHVFYNVS
jgi:hypothetical protein